MIIKYTDNGWIRKREKVAQAIFDQLPYRYVFITGSFISKEHFKDIDVFVISRSKKKHKPIPDANIQFIDFNDLHSLFYHSIKKQCIAKNILPIKPLKVTMADYWDVINEGYPTLINEQKNFRKHIRGIVLYIHYFTSKEILGSIDLDKRISQFKEYTDVERYIGESLPRSMSKITTKSYRKRYFYTQAASYKDLFEYEAYKFLYDLSHQIAKA